MPEPQIAVIIPAYNSAPYLGEALESVAWQTLQPSEVVVVDDGSTDCTGQIAASFDGVRVVRQENGGPSAARNTGVAETAAPIIAFLDADDIWLPDKLERQAAALLADDSLGYVLAQLRTYLSDGCEMPASYRAERLGTVFPSPLPSSWFLRRKAFEQVGPFTTELRLAEDVEWLGRASNLGIPSFMVPDVLSLRRVHETNISMVDPLAHRSVITALRSTLRARRQGQGQGVETS
jgi:glycosyltransferase involved in cell wall biosynthesis